MHNFRTVLKGTLRVGISILIPILSCSLNFRSEFLFFLNCIKNENTYTLSFDLKIVEIVIKNLSQMEKQTSIFIVENK